MQNIDCSIYIDARTKRIFLQVLLVYPVRNETSVPEDVDWKVAVLFFYQILFLCSITRLGSVSSVDRSSAS